MTKEEFPKISIITPSFNQGQFLETTILSVIGQGYPNLEYIVIDGGSTDQSVEIIEKYQKDIDYWVSEKDSGQANAINKGFRKATGDILAWINSDDYYLPNTLFKVSRSIQNVLEPALIHGGCIHTHEDSLHVFARNEDNVKCKLKYKDPLVQPATFWTRKLWEMTGNLNEAINYVFDWEWYIRASEFATFIHIKDHLSVYRKHPEHKSGSGGQKREQEVLDLINKYSSPNWYKIYKNGLVNNQSLKKKLNWLKKLKLYKFRYFLLPYPYCFFDRQALDKLY